MHVQSCLFCQSKPTGFFLFFFFCHSHCRRCRHCLNSLLGIDGSLRRGCDVLIAFSLPPKDPPTPPHFKVQAKSKIVTKRRKNVQTYKAISHSKTVRIITKKPVNVKMGKFTMVKVARLEFFRGIPPKFEP